MTRVVLTYREYAALPDDGRRYEIHDGELSVTPAPGTKHQIISANLYDIVREHVKTRGLGLVLYAPLDVILADTTIVQPDIVFVATDRRSRVSQRAEEGPRTPVSEFLWRSTIRTDRWPKLQL